ncbi:hypothetical protein PRZ48_005903 [Zasmidium cellare]|uniref:Uncharacterized protein n=1 Tax=Zasmidium cellare TaxID=395010 RepID=A0ABR0ENT5_ZASCE|nr:hypothetical protein PRZ48_005903 [Zasmidium cellare]
MATHAVQARSLYRRFLRELPARTPSILANPSPLQKHIRSDFSHVSNEESASLAEQTKKPAERRLEEAKQYLHYLIAQRTYTTLLERYNPGMNMTEEDRVRLTARRVGMDLPVELTRGGCKFANSMRLMVLREDKMHKVEDIASAPTWETAFAQFIRPYVNLADRQRIKDMAQRWPQKRVRSDQCLQTSHPAPQAKRPTPNLIKIRKRGQHEGPYPTGSAKQDALAVTMEISPSYEKTYATKLPDLDKESGVHGHSECRILDSGLVIQPTVPLRPCNSEHNDFRRV